MVSALAQPAMKFVPRMLSIFWMMVLKWAFVSFYVKHARKWVSHWLSMPKMWLLVGSACAKIGYLFAKHAQKLFTRWLSIRENHFGAPCVFLEFSLCSHSVPRCSVPFTVSRTGIVSRPISPVLRLCSLSPVLCPLSYVSVRYLPSSVSCLTSLSLASRPLSPVLVLCSLSLVFVPCPFYPVLYTLSHIICPLSLILLSPSLTPINCPSVPFCVALFYSSCPLFLCFLFSFPLSLVLCPLSFILARLQVFLGGHTEERIEK